MEETCPFSPIRFSGEGGGKTAIRPADTVIPFDIQSVNILCMFSSPKFVLKSTQPILSFSLDFFAYGRKHYYFVVFGVDRSCICLFLLLFWLHFKICENKNFE